MAPHIRSHTVPCSCFPKMVSVQLSSEQSTGDVRIMQLDWKRVPQCLRNSKHVQCNENMTNQKSMPSQS